MKFSEYPLIQPTGTTQDGLPVFELKSAFMYYIGFKNSPVRALIPMGILTNFTSVPRLLRCFFDPIDPMWANAALIHDYLYDGGAIKIYDLEFQPSRKQADMVFFESMIANKNNPTPMYIAVMFYLVVRAFGSSHWSGKK